jgi:tetratricopeptide (TPR) repeat protein
LGLPEAPYHEARVREMRERPEEAVVLYRRWGQRQPERWDSVLRAAECRLDLQQQQEAVREIREGLQRFPDHIELYSHLSQIYLLLNDRAEAARLCDRWAPLDRDSGRPERVRGKIALGSGDTEGALRWLEAALRQDDTVAAYHADLADALLREPTPQRLARARAALERAIDLEPANPAYYSQLGSVLQQLGDLEAARRALLRALERDSRSVEPYVSLVAVARRLRRPGTAALFAGLERQVREQQRAEQASWERLRQAPRSPEARFAMAAALAHRGALAKAGDLLEAAV